MCIVNKVRVNEAKEKRTISPFIHVYKGNHSFLTFEAKSSIVSFSLSLSANWHVLRGLKSRATPESHDWNDCDVSVFLSVNEQRD